MDRREFAAEQPPRESISRAFRGVEMIEEETTTYSTRRRHSVKSIQAMGNAFKVEDEGEIFDSVYLGNYSFFFSSNLHLFFSNVNKFLIADLKEGRCAVPGPSVPDFDRISELRMRNSMCRPHLKSSYAVETHFQPVTLNEDDIKVTFRRFLFRFLNSIW